VTEEILDRLSTGLVHASVDGQTLWINRAAAVLFNAKPTELVGQPLLSYCQPLERLLAKALANTSTLTVTEAHILSDGPVLDLFVHVSKQVCWIEMHPVSERLRLRERTERAERQQAVSLLARSLAHELRNPLAGVRGAAQLIEHSNEPATAHRHAKMIQREVDRITALIENVAEDSPPCLQTLNLHQVLDDALELVQAESGGQLQINRQFDPSIPDQRADGVQLHQLFLNLLRNSVQAGASALRVSSRIEHESAWLESSASHAIRLDIDDNGDGVPTELMDRLFLPLVTGRDQGTGFGLAVVQQIARCHGGMVDYSDLEGGSRFTLRLPLAREHPQ